MTTPVRVTARGAKRWQHGHPWIYRSDILDHPDDAGLVAVHDPKGRFIGQALYSPASEIQLRLLERTGRTVDAAWWRERLQAAHRRRAAIDATAYRVVHGEGDRLPSLVVDRYDRWIVAQLLSAGLETFRQPILETLVDLFHPEGILLRNDVPVRGREGLPTSPELVHGTVPEAVVVREGAIRYVAAPWTGQKTGAFLDQRANRILAGTLVRPGGRALDCFSYHGSFALHLARQAGTVLALDASRAALDRGAANAELNELTNIEWREGNAFEILRELAQSRERFDTIVLDPPAFAKSRGAVRAALRGYREINVRALKSLAPGGTLLTASCSFHVRRADFLAMLAAAAADSGRPVILRQVLGQAEDHPEILTVPETGYLKGAVLEIVA